MARALPQIGDALGKYTLSRQLGEGGMGVVYEARHTKLNHVVAIKVLKPEYAQDPTDAARFEREAHAAAALKSPYVVRIIDIDSTRDGLPYIVMEHLDGLDLADALSQGARLATEDIVGWTVQVCHALGEAHARGIIHRDI